MKVFISHQQRDSILAKKIYGELKDKNVEAYLDVLDNLHENDSEYLTNHLKKIMSSSSDILVIMTKNTKDSWWVPFEIGMAAEKDLRTVTYLHSLIDLPEYLDYWPRLSSIDDLNEYIEAHNKRLREERIWSSRGIDSYNFDSAKYTTKDFYDDLKNRLARK